MNILKGKGKGQVNAPNLGQPESGAKPDGSNIEAPQSVVLSGTTVNGMPVSGEDTGRAYPTAEVVEGRAQPVGADKADKLRVGPILTAQSLLDSIRSMDEGTSTRLGHLLQSLARLTFTVGSEVFKRARELASDKDHDGANKDESALRRLSEGKAIFTAISMGQTPVEHFNGMGWHKAVSAARSILEQKRLLPSGNPALSREEREARKARLDELQSVKDRTEAEITAVKMLPAGATREEVTAAAARIIVQQAQADADGDAPDAFLKVADCLKAAKPHAQTVFNAPAFYGAMPQAAREVWSDFLNFCNVMQDAATALREDRRREAERNLAESAAKREADTKMAA